MEVNMTKIMLVEDDKSLREIYGVRLLAEGYEIISAGDGEEALAMAVKEKPDLILSDVMMPKISGFDMLDILRSTPETKNIKVIMMTALSSEDQRARGEKLGANRYLVKSQVGIEDVVRTVHDLMADMPVAAAPTARRFGIPTQSAAIINQPTPQNVVHVMQPVAPAITAPEEINPIPVTPQPVAPILQPTAPITAVAPESPVIATAYQAVEPAQTPQPIVAPNPAPVLPVMEPQAPPAQFTAPAVTPVQPQANPTQLPQPTAPFSTAAPASLGDRIINPITPIAPAQDMSALMNQELHDGSETTPQNPIQ